jgi:hypothetical protein
MRSSVDAELQRQCFDYSTSFSFLRRLDFTGAERRLQVHQSGAAMFAKDLSCVPQLKLSMNELPRGVKHRPINCLVRVFFVLSNLVTEQDPRF